MKVIGMPLFKVKAVPEVIVQEGEMSKIRQRRLQLLVHSYIYYELGESVVSDATWQKWADELVKLQKEYPAISSKVVYAQEFKDFDGTTGYHLPYREDKIVQIAHWLVNYNKGGE